MLFKDLPGSSSHFPTDTVVFPRERLVRCLIPCWTPWAWSFSHLGVCSDLAEAKLAWCQQNTVSAATSPVH